MGAWTELVERETEAKKRSCAANHNSWKSAVNRKAGKTLGAIRTNNQSALEIMPRLFLASFLAAFLLLAGCASEEADVATDTEATNAAPEYLEDLVITDLVDGDGQMIQAGQRAEVHYTLWMRDTTAENHRGEMLQSSKEADRTFTFTVGQGGVIPGWDQGVPGMKVGGTRELRIPYRLAYGERGMPGGIPPRADLIFEIDLISIQ